MTRLASATDDGMPSTIVAARLMFYNPKWLKRWCHSSAYPALRVKAAQAEAWTGVTLITYCYRSFTIPTTEALSSTPLQRTESPSLRM